MEKKKTYNLFLDDFRTPRMAGQYMTQSEYCAKEWTLVENYDEFVMVIEKVGMPDLISFDHDLADVHYKKENQEGTLDYDKFEEKTGYHCAKWLVEYCIDNELKLPRFLVHSMSVVGKKNIQCLLDNFRKHQETND